MKLSPLVQYQRRMNWLGTQGHGVKGQGHSGSTLKILWVQYLLNPWTYFHESFTTNSLSKEDKLITYSRSWGQRSRSYQVNLENPVGPVSPEPLKGFSWHFLYLKEDELISFQGHGGQGGGHMGSTLKVFWAWYFQEPGSIFSKLLSLVYCKRSMNW